VAIRAVPFGWRPHCAASSPFLPPLRCSMMREFRQWQKLTNQPLAPMPSLRNPSRQISSRFKSHTDAFPTAPRPLRRPPAHAPYLAGHPGPPLASLEFSAVRPSECEAFSGGSGSTKRTASPSALIIPSHQMPRVCAFGCVISAASVDTFSPATPSLAGIRHQLTFPGSGRPIRPSRHCGQWTFDESASFRCAITAEQRDSASPRHARRPTRWIRS